jgi:hypothetical protein
MVVLVARFAFHASVTVSAGVDIGVAAGFAVGVGVEECFGVGVEESELKPRWPPGTRLSASPMRRHC